MPNDNDIERRFMDSEVRAVTDANGKPIITGYSPVYNQRSSVIAERGKKFIEVILPGAIDKILPVSDVRGRYNHDVVLARTKNGTLELVNTEKGLQYTIHVNESDRQAMDAYSRIQRGEVDGSSFAFTVPPDGDSFMFENGMQVRYIREISSLMDVGPVDFPAYPAATTSASVRSKLETFQQEETLSPEQAASSGAEAQVKARQAARRRSIELLSVKYPQ